MTMFKEVNRIIFDLDNTLIEHDFEKENMLVRGYLGIENDETFINQFRNIFKSNIAPSNCSLVTEMDFVQIIEECMPILSAYNKTGKDVLEAIYMSSPGSLMSGAEELLRYLYDKGYAMIILTNWFYSHQLAIIKRLGIYEYFERVYAWDSYYPKPNRLAMLRALENTAPENNILIGDDPIGDITLAKNCGLHAIGFNIDYTNMKKCKKIKEADLVVSDLREIMNYL